ncbi:MAG: rod shape-determining protein MreC [Ignavibacteriae bacterium]|nr:rod shape-determining protein MreC [Ignavibacteriota bacterium]MCB9215927.1 rod shape-determining protein MreC [Ignavibacteria bacterium]
MYRIVDLILRYKEYAATILLTIISLLLISGDDEGRIRSFRTISVGIIASVQSAFDWVPNPWALETENHALRSLNRDLSLEAMRLRDAGVKVEELRKMLEFKEKSPMKLVAAEVVGKPTLQLRNYITIDVGSEDGVKEGMPVITPAGLVGRVVGLDDENAVVLLVINADSRIAARTLQGRNNGILFWDKEEKLLLRNIPSVLTQEIGDTVITSGLSSFYPEDIVIGTVSEVEEEQGTLYHKITVTPTVSFATLEEVYVVLFTPDTKRLELERKVLEQVGSASGGKQEQ